MTDPCHETEPLHSGWLDGALSPVQRARVGRHLADCAACRGDLERLRAVRGLLRSMPVRQLPDSVRRRAAALGGPVAAAGAGDAGLPVGGWRRLARRTATGLAMAISLLTGAAFALGGNPGLSHEPAEGLRTVQVPVELYVADHLVRAVGGPLSTPVLSEGRR